MKIQVNGEPKELNEGTTVLGLLSVLALEPAQVAVELNAELLLRSRWSTAALKPNDCLEIVTFVGGG